MIRGRARGVIERVFLGNKKGSRPKKTYILSGCEGKILSHIKKYIIQE